MGDACAVIWGTTTIGAPQDWLGYPIFAAQLNTQVPYVYLAANLINAGLVDVSGCPDSGVQSNGAATTCGLQKAAPLVIEWQNRFDEDILDTARANGLPAPLLKRIFMQESQVWPGVSPEFVHFGFGHVTNVGLDPLLIFNPAFFTNTCQAVFTADTCAAGYLGLSPGLRTLLRDYILTQYVDAECTGCPGGIDVAKAVSSIDVFAKLLIANCQQVDQIIYSESGASAGSLSTYEDLWKMTLANYNTGPGCVQGAIHETLSKNLALTWNNVAANLGGVPFLTLQTMIDPKTISSTTELTPICTINQTRLGEIINVNVVVISQESLGEEQGVRLLVGENNCTINVFIEPTDWDKFSNAEKQEYFSPGSIFYMEARVDVQTTDCSRATAYVDAITR